MNQLEKKLIELGFRNSFFRGQIIEAVIDWLDKTRNVMVDDLVTAKEALTMLIESFEEGL